MSRTETVNIKIDPHVLRKMKQAERNMNLHVSGSHRRNRTLRARKWAREFERWLQKVDASINKVMEN